MTAMRGRFGKERNLPASGVECPGMRWACVTDPATRIVAHAYGILQVNRMVWTVGVRRGG